ncbi:MAG: DUF4097 family beta strand repeat-containing protein [Bacillota bacterium]
MKINRKQLLIIALLCIAAGAVILGIGRAVWKQKEGSYIMENQSYAVSDINRIQIKTDSPNVLIIPVAGDQINLTWQTDDYVEYEAKVSNGELTIDYRISANWLESLLLMPMVRNEYLLEVELPEGFTGSLDVHTASGAVAVENAPALQAVSLTSVSGKIELRDIGSKEGVEIRNTSGSVIVNAVNAAEDIGIRTVSGSVALTKGAAQGSVALQTASGSITVDGLTAGGEIAVQTTSGTMNVSQATGSNMTFSSVSGAVKTSGTDSEAFTAKTVSGMIDCQNLTAGKIGLRSTSGAVKGTVNGVRDEYSVRAHTVSGKSNLQSDAAGRAKTLTLDTVSGSIDLSFSGVAGN